MMISAHTRIMQKYRIIWKAMDASWHRETLKKRKKPYCTQSRRAAAGRNAAWNQTPTAATDRSREKLPIATAGADFSVSLAQRIPAWVP
jgi:hypothetical protein